MSPSRLYDMYEFTPQPDITVYELALVVAFRIAKQYRYNSNNYKFKPTLWVPAGEPFNARMPDWPDEMGRHYTRTGESLPDRSMD